MTNEKLATLIQQGQREYISELYDRVKKLLNCKARDYFNKFYEPCSRCGVGLDDLYQEAFLAMLDAARSFKPNAGHNFTTYLSYPVTNRFKALTNCRRGKRNPLNNSESLDEPLSSKNGNFTLKDTVQDKNSELGFEDVERNLYQNSLHKALEDQISKLNPISQTVIRCRYYQRQTLEQTGEIIGCSRDVARQHEYKALGTLRKPKAAKALKPFLYFDYESLAYRGTGLSSFKSRGGSAPEIITERAADRLERILNKIDSNSEKANSQEKRC